MKTNTK